MKIHMGLIWKMKNGGKMTEKRFTIEKSSIVEDGFFIYDTTGKFSFPTTKDKSNLIMYEKQLNELNNENEQLKKEKDYYKRELQKELVCQAIIEGRENNE